jgi:electron-transferring-flavoprotein dehydrogenase
MKSGMLAAETAFSAITSTETETEPENPVDMAPYEQAVKDSWIWKELHQVRNLRPSFHNPLGLYGGVAYSGLDSLVLRGKVPWTFRNKVEDYAHTKKAR